MDPIARILLSDSLVDTKQPVSMKVLQNPDGSFVLQLQIGLLAEGKPWGAGASDQDKKTKRDAVVEKELCADSIANIGMAPSTNGDGTTTFTVALSATGGTKIPGTGFGVKALDLSKLGFK